MSLFDIRKIAVGLALGFAVLIMGSGEVNAQSRRELERERQRIQRQQERLARQRQYDARYRTTERGVSNANYNHGYSQGMLAGEYDRRRGKYNQSNVYRNTGSYPNAGDPTSADYIYRQAFLQGYSDGFYGRRNY